MGSAASAPARARTPSCCSELQLRSSPVMCLSALPSPLASRAPCACSAAASAGHSVCVPCPATALPKPLKASFTWPPRARAAITSASSSGAVLAAAAAPVPEPDPAPAPAPAPAPRAPERLLMLPQSVWLCLQQQLRSMLVELRHGRRPYAGLPAHEHRHGCIHTSAGARCREACAVRACVGAARLVCGWSRGWWGGTEAMVAP